MYLEGVCSSMFALLKETSIVGGTTYLTYLTLPSYENQDYLVR